MQYTYTVLTSLYPAATMSKRKRTSSPPSSPPPVRETRELPIFLSKLITIMDSAECKSSIDWNKDGTTIIISDVIKFQNSVLRQYFKHANFASFARQLNM